MEKETILKSSSFNRTIISDENTREIVSKLIRKEFDSIPSKEYWRHLEIDELIKCAINLGLTELASEMTNDNF